MKKASFLAVIFLLCDSCFAQGWVVLSVQDYESLHARAYPAPPEPEAPPVEATLTRVDYNLRVEGAVATGTAQLTIDVLKDGWVRVPVPPGLLVREARTGSSAVALIPTQQGQLAAVLSKRGRTVIILDVVFTVASSAGEERLSLPVGASGITRASVTATQPDLEVTVTGGLAPENEASRDKAPCWTTYASGSGPLVLAWRKRAVERQQELPLRMRGSLTQLFGLGEDSTSLNAEAQIEVLQGAAKQVKIAVPDSVTINQVPGALVADWDVKNSELLVNFLDPVEHTASFTILGESKLAKDGTLTIPLLGLTGVERETGGVAVEVQGAGEIKSSMTQGLEPAEAAELGPLVASRQSPSLAVFKPRPGGGPRGLQVQVVRYAQQAMLTANIEEARYRALMTAGGRTLVEARYAVRNNQRDFVKVALPAGSVLWSASVSGRDVRPGESSDGGVLIALDKNRAGEEAELFPVELLYLVQGPEWSPKGRAALPLPAVDLPVSRTGVVLFYPPLFRVSLEPGAFRTQAFENPVSDVLNGQRVYDAGAPQLQTVAGTAAQRETQALVSRYRARWGRGKSAESAPPEVSFPALGPSMFFASELTDEGKAPVVELSYQKGKDGGAQ